MFENLEIFRMAGSLLRHAAARQAVISANVANADTPGYRARDVAGFSETYRRNDAAALRVTRPGHMRAPADTAEFRVIVTGDGETSPDGNSVSLEAEMVKAAEVRNQHELALSVYSKSLDILRTSLGRRR